MLVSMAPLSQEVQLLSSCVPPHLGPPVAEMNSIWFKLWLYNKLGCGPPSLLLAKGNRLRRIPGFIKVSLIPLYCVYILLLYMCWLRVCVCVCTCVCVCVGGGGGGGGVHNGMKGSYRWLRGRASPRLRGGASP